MRVLAAKHILRVTNASSWRSHVAIDPCYSLLPKKLETQEEQKIAAMGKMRWASEGSRRDECNLRGPATANAQKGSYVTRVDWTPIIARGKLSIYVGAADEAEHDQSLPKKLADAFHLAMEQILAPAVHLAPSILMAIAACSCARSSQGSTRFENKLHKC